MTKEATRFDRDCKSFEQARVDVIETGFLLAAYETLILALKDRRLQQAHRAVLAELIVHMNRRTATTWIGRDEVSRLTGLSVKTVSNSITELIGFGFVLAENRRTPEAENRSLRHYTIAGLSKEEVERCLLDAVASIRAKTPRCVNFPSQGEAEIPLPRGTTVVAPNSFSPASLPTFPAQRAQ